MLIKEYQLNSANVVRIELFEDINDPADQVGPPLLLEEGEVLGDLLDALI
jgi:hypothetical protein